MLSIVIPCKNEGESIFPVIQEIKDVMRKNNITYEIVIVNNNSTDNTREESLRAGDFVRVVDCETPGYGAAIQYGVSHSTYDLICKLDGDGSYNPEDIPIFLRLHAENPQLQLVIGNRFSTGNTQNMHFLNRVFGVPALNLITNVLFPSQYYVDAHCGLRVFKKDIIKDLNLTHTDFSFANEMICKALKKKTPIAEVPIILRKDLRVQNSSKIKLFKDGFDALSTIVKIRLTD